ncbi:DUF2975 domain-containing protein [Virgibacillus sp. W0181]|uniref:DUF2975 domain-containing protein n=1 Tax=Virgibacillus sp. W0181 TaxID=3391581 RepID=UPI003F445469
MQRGTTLLLKIVIYLIAVMVFTLFIFWLPSLANDTAEMFPEFSYLQFPVLIGLYVIGIPFYFALYKALKLITLIDNNNAFSDLPVNALKKIKYCAITISILYALGATFLLTQNALHPGIAIIVLTIIFSSVVIAVFAMVLQKLLKSALDIKSENDLTV